MPKPNPPSMFQDIFIVPPPIIYNEIQSGNKKNLVELLKSRFVPPQIDLAEALTLAIPHPDIFKILLDTYQSNNFKILGDVLQHAAKHNYQAIVKLLLEYLHREDIYFSTPLELQKQYPEEMIEHHINKGMALMYASEKGHLEALNALLEDKSIFELVTWCQNILLRKAQKKKKNATTKKEQALYNQIIVRLIDIPAVAQLAEQKGEIFEKIESSETNQSPILITFHSLETTQESDILNDTQEPSQSSCRLS